MVTARTVFSAAALVFAVAYTYYSFELDVTSSAGSIGPGFFPRILGFIFVACCAYSLWRVLHGYGKPDSDEEAATSAGEHWRAVGFVTLLSALFIAALPILGGLLGMIVFTFIALVVLNRGRWITNVAVSLLLPIGLYLLFETFLNAAMPRGAVPLPF